MLKYTFQSALFIIIKKKIPFDLMFVRQILIWIYLGWQKRVNMNTNKFSLKHMAEYKYEFIWDDKKGWIWIQIRIYGLLFANTNTDICHTL